MPNKNHFPNYDEFSEWVRDVLTHLYDSAYLQTHPLAELLVDETTDTRHRSQRLRRMMLDAIRTMYPAGVVSVQSPDWRTYKVLELRYVQGLNWAEVMDKLALGKTLYYRSHALALEALTQAIWDGLQLKQAEALRSPEEGVATRQEEAQLTLEHLVRRATWEAVEIIPVLEELRSVVFPLAQAKNVSLSFDLAHAITVLRADRVMLRQAMLNVISYALDISLGQRVAVTSCLEGNETGICIQGWRGGGQLPAAQTTLRQGFGLDICEQLMWQMGGVLYLETKETNAWQARLVWPTSVKPVLLVIDDNEGLVELFQRYLAGSDWRIVGAANGTEARQAISQTCPGVIILDIMMPGEDGWELLMDFKANANTRDIPVIICSVLKEPQLAQNLGAAAYLAKPVAPEALLQILKPWHQAGATVAPGH